MACPAAQKECENKPWMWQRVKWESEECVRMNITESYILQDKFLVLIARHPSINTVANLDTTLLIWPHRRQWGEEIVVIMRTVQEGRNAAADQESYRSIVIKGIKGYWAWLQAVEAVRRKVERVHNTLERKQVAGEKGAVRLKKQHDVAATKKYKKLKHDG
jgi:hypothetical protein